MQTGKKNPAKPRLEGLSAWIVSEGGVTKIASSVELKGWH